MAVLNHRNPTLLDWAKRIDPNGMVESQIVEILNENNETLEDATFVEGNSPLGHRVVIRTGLPPSYWRALNQGVPRSKSTTAQVDESFGMLEAYSSLDVDLAILNGNTSTFRLSEDAAFLESMAQNQAKTIFYGNPADDPRQYLGLAPRYSSKAGGNAKNIIDAGGTGTANTSIWLVVWGPSTVFCTFPKGSKAGLVTKDDGEMTVYDDNNNPFKAFQTHYQWKNGLVVKDWRYAVRIANVDVAAANNPSFIHLLIKAIRRIPNIRTGRAAFYMNPDIFEALQIQAYEKTSNVLAIKEGLSQFGVNSSWMQFMGVPLRRADALLNTEARVV